MDWNTVVAILALIALAIGIVLALFGRAIWGMLLAAIGGMIGWMIGFAIGVILFGFGNLMAIILVFICGFVGSFIMGAIFRFLVEVALALLAAILAAGPGHRCDAPVPGVVRQSQEVRSNSPFGDHQQARCRPQERPHSGWLARSRIAHWRPGHRRGVLGRLVQASRHHPRGHAGGTL